MVIVQSNNKEIKQINAPVLTVANTLLNET